MTLRHSHETAAAVTGRAHAASSEGRIEAFDGLRGLAALAVVVFHYLCMFHPRAVQGMAPDTLWAAHTPLGLAWNGPFAVMVFFALSGFVLAAAAERRRSWLIVDLGARYLRLALPVTASVILAWALLSALPTATRDLAEAAAAPSKWWAFTLQGDIPGLGAALRDGLWRNFVTGNSGFNNVLWTMQIELVGSFAIFIGYRLVPARARPAALAVAGAGVIAMFHAGYFAFVLGAALHEARSRGLPERAAAALSFVALPPAALPVAALTGAALILAPGPEWWDRLGAPWIPPHLIWGRTAAFPDAVAAAAAIYGALALPAAARALSAAIPRWLGRVSFGLYLVHVPPLYTLGAWAHGEAGLPSAAIAPLYFAGALALAHLFTVAVDEPVLRGLGRLRGALAPRRPRAPNPAPNLGPSLGRG